MTVEARQIARLAPLLWGLAGLMFGAAAWREQSVAYLSVAVMFLVFSAAAWLNTRKAGGK